MSLAADRNIWIPSRVPQTLQCSECNRTAEFAAFRRPDQYEYSCPACGAKKLLSLTQINTLESSRFRKLPINVPPLITAKRMDLKP